MPSWTSQYAGVDREAIWAALLGHFRTTLGATFKTMGRRHIQPPELPEDAQPAFFLLQMQEKRSGSARGEPSTLLLSGYLVLYTPAPATAEVPGVETQLAATALNGFYKQIDDAMAPDDRNTGKFTIGGLVQHCYLEGHVDQDPGIFGSQAAAILPIHILVP